MLTRTQALKNLRAAQAELAKATDDAVANHGGAETDWYLRANKDVDTALSEMRKYYPGLAFWAG